MVAAQSACCSRVYIQRSRSPLLGQPMAASTAGGSRSGSAEQARTCAASICQWLSSRATAVTQVRASSFCPPVQRCPLPERITAPRNSWSRQRAPRS